MDVNVAPVSGIYEPHHLQKLCYGPEVVSRELLQCLPSPESRAVIVTGTSLATKTPLVKQVEDILTSKHHQHTFRNIRQHAPVQQIDEAVEVLRNDSAVDTIISIGGGSPIDTAKVISFRFNELHGRFLTHIAIPTTLSAAECTDAGGITLPTGLKQSVRHEKLAPTHVLYDAEFALYTPPELFMSTGFRALDHAVELQYNASATWMPCRLMCLQAAGSLFKLLPAYRDAPTDTTIITGLFLAAYGSLGFLGKRMKGPLGLSHTLGYALGSPYGIPHGITSCMTLGHVVKVKARLGAQDAAAVANVLPYLGHVRSGDDVSDANRVGDCILQLVKDLGLFSTLSDRGVEKDQVDVICDRSLDPWKSEKGQSPTNDALRAAVTELVLGLF